MLDAQGEEMYSWGEEHVLHLCGGSLTTPRTVWWHDFGVFVRPLVEVAWADGEHRDIVMWEEYPRRTGRNYDKRMEYNAWYITESAILAQDNTWLEKCIIENGALEQFGSFIRRDVWQRMA